MWAKRSDSILTLVISLAWVGLILALTASQPGYAAGPIYVDADATGANDGTSWGDAYTDLQTALANAVSGDEIWVAEGVYYPDEGAGQTNDSRNATFQLISGVALYGGFDPQSDVDAWDERDWETYVTVLSGDVDGNDSQSPVITDLATVTGNSTNAYHVVTGATGATLDGFTVTAGHADGRAGGGIYNVHASPLLTHLVVRGNKARNGGGIGNDDDSLHQGSHPTISHVTVQDNAATLESIGWGGGIYNGESCPTITDSTIRDNRASSFGGGIGSDNRYGATCRATLTRVLIDGNIAHQGGGMIEYFSSPDMTEVTISNNVTSGSTGCGGGIATNRSMARLVDCVIRGNTTEAIGGGGGIQNGWDSNISIQGGEISGNTAAGNNSYGGGGIMNNSGNATLIDVVIRDNQTIDGDGGGISIVKDVGYDGDVVVRLTNVLISGNRAAGSRVGGGISNWIDCTLHMTNTTISGNWADSGAGLSNHEGTVTMVNSIVWGNEAISEPQINNYQGTLNVTYSDIQGGYAGTGNIDADPLFVLPEPASSAPTNAGSYRLSDGSPAVDAGNNYSVTVSTDLDGHPRFVDALNVTDTGLGDPPIVDMGAYEFTGLAPELYAVKSNAVDGEVASDTPFTWTITISNTGATSASFDDTERILLDNLPTTGAAYGSPFIQDSSGVSGTVDCAVATTDLTCVASGVVTFTAETARLVVAVPVTPTDIVTLDNPRDGGVCQVDPDDVTAEMIETNNLCADSVAVGRPSFAVDIYNAHHELITSAPISETIYGQVTVSGPAGTITPTGVVTLTLHDNPACTGAAYGTQVKTLENGTATSDAAAARSFYYQVTYSGDDNHQPGTSDCGRFSAYQTGPTFTVNTTADDVFDDLCSDVHCTLRDAIVASNEDSGANTILFDVGYDQTIILTSTLPLIHGASGALRIDGQAHAPTVSGDDQYRVFKVSGGGHVTLAGLTVQRALGGVCDQYPTRTCGSGLKVDPGAVVTLTHSAILSSSAQLGGGVTNYGTLTVLDSTIANNTTIYAGGGIYNRGTLTLQNSTLSGNMAVEDWISYGGGGAIDQRSASALTIINSTIVSNAVSADFSGGGIWLEGGHLILYNTIIANNDSTNIEQQSGTFTSQGYNLSNDWNGMPIQATDLTAAPQLGPLANNGGGTPTHALLAGSPALDAGDPDVYLATDQRGIARPQGSRADIGALEATPDTSLAKTVTPTANAPYHGVVTYTIVLSNTGVTRDNTVLLTDALPSGVDFGRWVTQPGSGDLVQESGAITWTGTLSRSTAITFTFTATQSGDYNDVIVNTAAFSGTAQSGRDTATFCVTCADVLTVQNANDDGPGSLRESIGKMCAGGTIDFAGDYAIYLDSSLNITQPLTIDGSGHAVTVSGDSGNDGSRDVPVFVIDAGGPVRLSHMRIISGSTDTRGGGIVQEFGTPLTITHSIITDNWAQNGGAGIESQGPLTVVNCLFLNNHVVGNTVFHGGGGIRNVQGRLVVQGSSFAGNVAGSGGGIYNSPDDLLIANTILWGNEADQGAQIANSGAAAISYSDIQGAFASGSWDTDLGTDDGGNIDSDPLFVDPGAANLRLGIGSPAIDAGNNLSVTTSTDLDDSPRIFNGVVDMGAYEARSILTLTKSVTPTGVVPFHSTVTYTLTLSNTGAMSDTAILTDTLPDGVAFDSWVVRPTGTISQGNTITWTETISAGERITLVFTAVQTGDYGEVIANTAYFSSTAEVGHASATFSVNQPPVADAGEDQTVTQGELVQLDGSASSDPDGHSLTYRWAQTGGPAVSCTPNLSVTTFTAPTSTSVLTFSLTVTDTGGLSDTDEVVITVEKYELYVPLVVQNNS